MRTAQAAGGGRPGGRSKACRVSEAAAGLAEPAGTGAGPSGRPAKLAEPAAGLGGASAERGCKALQVSATEAVYLQSLHYTLHMVAAHGAAEDGPAAALAG